MNLPPDFITFAKTFFASESEEFLQSLNRPAPTSIRINRAKIPDSIIRNPVPWASSAYYPDKRPIFTYDPLFHTGCYYVQEASSMFLEQVFNQYIQSPVCMLDLCAAPGGKSTHALSLLPEGSLLVSNDVIRSRADILVENTTKWGYPNVIVTNNDASDFKRLTHFFDVVSVDAPCSGEGLFRKDPESVNQWSLNNISLCKERQQRILRDIWPCLKPGGLLIYSTCTYNTKENEENIERLLNTFDAEILPIRHEKTWNISTPVHPNIYRFFPHKVAGEGFSLSLIRKNDEESRHPIRIKTSPNKKQSPVVPDIKDRLIHPEKFRFSVKNNIITAFPEEIVPRYETIRSMLKIISAGITLAEIKGKDLSPGQSSATSIYLNKNKFETIEIDYKQALHYLCKEMLVLPPETPVSHLLVNYKNHPLGFVKNIGNRANNLYPQDWRIRTRYLPEEETIVINTDSQEPALP